MNSGDRGSNFILITRVHSTFYPHLLVFFIVLVNFVLLLWCFFVYVFLFGVFFLFRSFFGGDAYRLAEVCGRFWVGNKRRKKQTKQNIFSLKWKKGGHSSIVFSFVHSEWFSNGKMKLKSDIRIKILNDRYRPIIDLYVFKKKQTNKQTKTKNKSCMCQNQWLKREINPQQTKKQTKIKTKQNNNNKKGNDDLKGEKMN